MRRLNSLEHQIVAATIASALLSGAGRKDAIDAAALSLQQLGAWDSLEARDTIENILLDRLP